MLAPSAKRREVFESASRVRRVSYILLRTARDADLLGGGAYSFLACCRIRFTVDHAYLFRDGTFVGEGVKGPSGDVITL